MKEKNMGKFLTPKDFIGSANSKRHAMFLMLKKARKDRRSFIISKGFSGKMGKMKRMKRGLYGWIGKELMRLQRFDKKYKPRRTDWMGDAIKLLVKKRGGFEKVFRWELEKLVRNFNKGK